MGNRYFVYILTNKNNTTLYTGITNHLKRRVLQHKHGQGGHFTRKYALEKLVYFEETPDVKSAIAREKQLKAGSRRAKLALIEAANPGWVDLAEGW